MAKPIAFTRKDENGREHTRIAYTPAEAVRMRFDGWKQVPEPVKTLKPPAGESTTSKP